jgi:hypothetical protein
MPDAISTTGPDGWFQLLSPLAGQISFVLIQCNALGMYVTNELTGIFRPSGGFG